MTADAPFQSAPSLRRRLLRGLVVLHLLAMAATAGYSYLAFGRLVHHFLDEQMQRVALSQAAHPGASALVPLSIDDVQRQGAVVVQLWSPDGTRLIASSLPALTSPLRADSGFGEARTGNDESVAWRVYTAPAEDPALPRVQVLQSEAYRQGRVLQRALLEGLPILLLLPVAFWILWAIVSGASRSLRAVARDVARQDERSPAGVSPDRVPEEIAPLVEAFNSLLARTRGVMQTQRRFVQEAAHELRTPMAAIGLQIDNLRGHVPDGEASERFAQLEAGVLRAQHLIEQLLRMSRQDDAQADGATEPVNIAALLRDSVSQLMPLADQRRIDVGFDGRAALVLVASTSALRSLFDNLIDNALRYTPEGGTVDVRLHRVPGGTVVVDVVDSGPGIPPDCIERVFDRFYRVAGTAAGGSGLGLAIAQAAAHRHGLRIELRNRCDEREAEALAATGLIARVHMPA